LVEDEAPGPKTCTFQAVFDGRRSLAQPDIPPLT